MRTVIKFARYQDTGYSEVIGLAAENGLCLWEGLPCRLRLNIISLCNGSSSHGPADDPLGRGDEFNVIIIIIIIIIIIVVLIIRIIIVVVISFPFLKSAILNVYLTWSLCVWSAACPFSMVKRMSSILVILQRKAVVFEAHHLSSSRGEWYN